VGTDMMEGGERLVCHKPGQRQLQPRKGHE
jgi:hypothetical protein